MRNLLINSGFFDMLIEKVEMSYFLGPEFDWIKCQCECEAHMNDQGDSHQNNVVFRKKMKENFFIFFRNSAKCIIFLRIRLEINGKVV